MSELLQVAGSIAATAAVAFGLLGADRRLRALALVGGMTLALALVIGEGWDELEPLRDEPARLVVVLVGAVAILAALTAALLRRPALLPLLVVAALPFRVPIDVGTADDVNLLLPLYAVIGAGVLAEACASLRREPTAPTAPGLRVPRPLLLALVAVLGLYAVQASYSADISFAARNMAFFLVPFAAMFCLLAEVRWDGRLLGLAFGVLMGEAVLFAVIGVGQHIAGDIFWNPQLEASNDFHFYFRVNSLFWDPNIYSRYLALALVVAATVLVWTRDRRRSIALTGAIVVGFAGLLVAFSQSGFISLLFGLAVLCALRWSLRRTLVLAPVVALITVAGIALVGNASDQTAREVTEGRSTLVSGGLDLAKERPLHGYGSASFSKEFAKAEDVKQTEATSSHNEPVTVAAEQGVIGLIAYVALIAASLWALFMGMHRIAPGLGAVFRLIEDDPGSTVTAARVGIAAAFCALLVHTIGYADYLTDPLTWALLAIGATLAPGVSRDTSEPTVE